MGGIGSGNHWSRGKPTVENCWALDVVRLMHGRNPLRVYTNGTIKWSDAQTGQEQCSAGYSLLPDNGLMLLTLKESTFGMH